MRRERGEEGGGGEDGAHQPPRRARKPTHAPGPGAPPDAAKASALAAYCFAAMMSP